MDVHLVTVLSDLGISSDTAYNRGWKAFRGIQVHLLPSGFFGRETDETLISHTNI
jgi:hypothetical protein